MPDIAAAVNHSLSTLDLPQRSETSIRQWIGNGAEVLLHRALTNDINGHAEPELLIRQANLLFQEYYAAHLCDHTQLCPGANDILAWLQANKMPLACITNKPTVATHDLLRHLDIHAYFGTVLGGDDAAKKPAPDLLQLAAQHLGVPITTCLMVGDSSTDVAAARNAGCLVVAVSYGYNHGHDIREAEPDAVIDTLPELTTLLQRAA